MLARPPGRVVQQCGVGLVPIRIEDGGGLAFSTLDATLLPLDWALQPLLSQALGEVAIGTQHHRRWSTWACAGWSYSWTKPTSASHGPRVVSVIDGEIRLSG